MIYLFNTKAYLLLLVLLSSLCSLYGLSDEEVNEAIKPHNIDLKRFSRSVDLGYSGPYNILRMMKDSDIVCIATVKKGKHELKAADEVDMEAGGEGYDIDHLLNYDLHITDFFSSKLQDIDDYKLIIDSSVSKWNSFRPEEFIPIHNIAEGKYILFLDVYEKGYPRIIKKAPKTAYLKIHQGKRGIIPLSKTSNVKHSVKVLKKDYNIVPFEYPDAIVKVFEMLVKMIKMDKEYVNKNRLEPDEFEIYKKILNVDMQSMIFGLKNK